MRPAILPLAGRIGRVGQQAVAAENAGERGPEQAPQHVRPARRRNRVEHEGRRHQGPEPAFRRVRAVPGLVGVEHRLGGQGRLEFLVRRADGGTGLFPGLLRAPQTDRDLQRAFEEPLDDQTRQPAHDRQIRNQGRELRAELPLRSRPAAAPASCVPHARQRRRWQRYSMMCASMAGNSVT